MKLLQIRIKKYYSSEICKNALAVSQDCHSADNLIEYIGDASKLTKQQIIDLGPIDLLLGGPPCNELSRVNKDRKKFGM